MSKQGIPLGHETFSGNTNDVNCFKQMIDKVSDRFKLSRIIFVGDRGMISKNNLSHLEKNGFEYILGYRMRTISKKDRAKVFEKANLKKLRNSSLHYKEVEYKGKRLIFCYNKERAEKDALKREEILNRIQEKIKAGNIQALIDNQNYKRFCKIKGQKPILDEEKIKKDELYDGVFVLTSNTKLSPMQVVQSYKGLWQVEAAFKQLKSELEVGPIFHWKDRRIKAHIMICFIALILRSVFYKKLKTYDKDVSFSEAFHDLKALKAMKIKIDKSEIIMRTELKPLANAVFRAVGMRVPNRILSSESYPQVVIRQN